MNLRLLSDSGNEPVTLEEAKTQLRYTDDDQDDYISGLITAARIMAEIFNGRQQTVKYWDLALDHWPNSPVTGISAIPNPYFGFWPSDAYRLLAGIRPEVSGIELAAPLIAVTSVTYRDIGGNLNTLTQNVDYVVDTWKEPGLICPYPNTNWPIVGLWPTSAVHVQFTSGKIPDASAVSAWASGTAYSAGAAVSYGGTTWLALLGSTNVAPGSDSVTWAMVTDSPRHIKQGILLLVTQWFEDRLPFDAIRFVAEIPFSVTALFTSDKLWV